MINNIIKGKDQLLYKNPCCKYFWTSTIHSKFLGYGLPLSKEPNKKGDILVTFDIQFPEKLSQNTKDLLHDLLPNKT